MRHPGPYFHSIQMGMPHGSHPNLDALAVFCPSHFSPRCIWPFSGPWQFIGNQEIRKNQGKHIPEYFVSLVSQAPISDSARAASGFVVQFPPSSADTHRTEQSCAHMYSHDNLINSQTKK
uniref:Uncharacterized protein n=1 Tax=Eutreptiella gymnastica TaxID=73025 RepID=A0A7S1IFH7_9EUGL|mmetsp:Transcript_152622/g.266491  ORF Transcript_152622/g.266491 Transcript_152622/m.266491 type:complete len:120 (+) Transcript_152622:84-443(+)